MSETRPLRPTLALILSIWLIVVFCWSTLSLAGASLLARFMPAMPHLPPVQLALVALSALLALGGGITLLQMKPLAWQLLIARVLIDLVTLVVTTLHPAALPAGIADNPNAAAAVSAGRTGGIIFGVLMLAVNLAIALYARSATTKSVVAESTPAAA